MGSQVLWHPSGRPSRHDGQFHSGHAEGRKSRHRHQLEISGIETLIAFGLEGFVQQQIQGSRADVVAVDPDAFQRRHKVRRGIPTHHVARGFHCIGQKRADAAFAVGSRDQNDRVAAVGTPQGIQQRGCVPQAFLDAPMTAFIQLFQVRPVRPAANGRRRDLGVVDPRVPVPGWNRRSGAGREASMRDMRPQTP